MEKKKTTVSNYCNITVLKDCRKEMVILLL